LCSHWSSRVCSGAQRRFHVIFLDFGRSTADDQHLPSSSVLPAETTYPCCPSVCSIYYMLQSTPSVPQNVQWLRQD
jgi:hypothetical protein